MNKLPLATAQFDATRSDMFGDLPQIDPLDVKKDEIGVQLTALLVHCEKNQSWLSEKLGWKKSRVSSVLSGKGNLTVETIWWVCSALDYQFDIAFRSPVERPVRQPWQSLIHADPLQIQQNEISTLKRVNLLGAEFEQMNISFSILQSVATSTTFSTPLLFDPTMNVYLPLEDD